MFLLKKIVSHLLFPVPVFVEVLLVGLVLISFTRRQKAGKALLWAVLLMLILLGNGRISGRLLGTLEGRYAPLSASSVSAQERMASAKYIVVLSGGSHYNPGLPAMSELAPESLARLVEGIRLYRQLPGRKLVLSGGAPAKSEPEAETMSKAAQALGVSAEDIRLETNSRDTEDEARFLQPMLGKSPFILVTSASHMPRSMAWFRKFNLDPIAAPADYLSVASPELSPDDFYPSAVGLLKAEKTVYEYLGLAWVEIKGRIQP